MRNIFTQLLLVLALAACNSKPQTTASSYATDETTEVKLSEAKGFTIHKSPKGYTIVTVLNPWDENKAYDRYYLVKDLAQETPDDGKKVLVPLQSIVANSATYLEFLQQLGVLDKVTGVCNSNYIYNPAILEGVGNGRIKDLGDAFNLDMENLLLLHPQAIMTSAYNAKDENAQRMEQAGLTVLYNIEWQESTLLGRAEWIKFIGAFFDKEAEADSLFRQTSTAYHEIRQKGMAGQAKRPGILSGQDFRGTWSMPAGESFNAQLFRDAGASYFYADSKGTGSIPTDIENALLHFKDADLWVGVQANTLEELAEADSKYKLFKAYRNGNVYNYNKRMNATGGNDYWESAIARPDLLLADFLKIIHPELLPDHELYYMQKLK